MKRLLMIVVFLLSTTAVMAQWSSNPAFNNPAIANDGEQVIAKVAANATGSYVSCFSNEGGNYDVRLQRFDVLGHAQWGPDGLLVSAEESMTWLTDYDLAIDHDGAAIVAFQDVRLGPNNIFAYRVLPDGTMAWGAEGLTLSNTSDFEVSPKVVITDENNAVFAWFRGPDAGNNMVMLQKVNPEGDLLWGETGLTLSSTSENYNWPYLVPSEDDAVILVWFKETGMPWAPVKHIYAQKFDADGNPVWAEDVPIFIGNIIPVYVQPVVESDGNGGAFIAWYGGQTMLSAYVQHIDNDGQITMAENGVQISRDSSRHHIAPRMAYIPDLNELMVFWSEQNSNQSLWGLYGQKLTVTGQRMWGSSGLCLLNLSTLSISAISTRPATADAIVVFEQYTFGNVLDSVIKAMRIDTDGNPVWEDGQVMLCSVQSGKDNLEISEYNWGQWIVAWDDDRNGNMSSYAQNIRLDGALGPVNVTGIDNDPLVSVNLTFACYPNPFQPDRHGRMSFIYQLDHPGFVDIGIYDISGREVKRIESGHQGVGPQTVHWNGLDENSRVVSSGVYFYRIKTNSNESNRRFVVFQ